MVSLNLEQQLSGHAFSYLLIFTRIGAAVMLFPAIGEAFVPPRMRMMFALFLSFLLYPVLAPDLPPAPGEVPQLARLLVFESLIGVFMGSLLRLLVSAIETAGAVVALQTGLSNAMILNPTMASQSALPSAFLGLAGVTLLMMTGLDHVMLRGLVNMYALFPAGAPFLPGDMADAYLRVFAKSFLVGVEISAPFMIVGLLMFIALGFMQRMVAQVQLFLVMLPVQIMGGALLFAVVSGAMLEAWLRYFDRSLAEIVLR